MITGTDICKSFDDLKALDGATFRVERGSVYGLVGPNGSGKSTLIRHIMGIYKQDSGELLIDGEPVYENTRVKNIISYVQKKNNCLVCNKNGYNCDIQILKLNANNKKLLTQLNNNENSIDNKSLYYLKMYGKKETFGINNIYKKFILNLE